MILAPPPLPLTSRRSSAAAGAKDEALWGSPQCRQPRAATPLIEAQTAEVRGQPLAATSHARSATTSALAACHTRSISRGRVGLGWTVRKGRAAGPYQMGDRRALLLA